MRLPAGTPAGDVINNAGGVVLREGYGADRGFQQPDRGQFDEPEEVFTACGNGLALRTDLGATVGWFDDDFFMYYEDVDLSWRFRARGCRSATSQMRCCGTSTRLAAMSGHRGGCSTSTAIGYWC